MQCVYLLSELLLRVSHVTLCSLNYGREFCLVHINYVEISKFQKQPLYGTSSQKNGTKRCKITCLFELDTRDSKTESALEFSSM